MEMLLFFISYVLGGFILGFIFLSFFDNITTSHVYISIIGVTTFTVNYYVTAYILEGPAFTKSVILGVILIAQFTVFLSAAYIGRRIRRKGN